MMVCPKCKKEYPNRKNGTCPGCGTPVIIYKGKWYLADDGTPTVAIIRQFERRVSEKQSKSRGIPVVFEIPRKGNRYKLELVFASRYLDEAAGDLDLVMASLDILFHDPDFNFKTQVSLVGLYKDYSLALAIAKAKAAAQQRKDKTEQNTFNALLEKEDVFL